MDLISKIPFSLAGGNMISKNGITRRSFVKKTSAGLGAIGLGHSSLAMAYPVGPGQPQEKMSPREALVLSVSGTGLDEKDIIGGMIERIALMSSYKPDIICLPRHLPVPCVRRKKFLAR